MRLTYAAAMADALVQVAVADPQLIFIGNGWVGLNVAAREAFGEFDAAFGHRVVSKPVSELGIAGAGIGAAVGRLPDDGRHEHGGLPVPGLPPDRGRGSDGALLDRRRLARAGDVLCDGRSPRRWRGAALGPAAGDAGRRPWPPGRVAELAGGRARPAALVAAAQRGSDGVHHPPGPVRRRGGRRRRCPANSLRARPCPVRRRRCHDRGHVRDGAASGVGRGGAGRRGHLRRGCIHPRSISPLDTHVLVGSARKTGRVLVADECSRSFGAGAELAAMLAEEAFNACGRRSAGSPPRTCRCPTASRWRRSWSCRQIASPWWRGPSPPIRPEPSVLSVAIASQRSISTDSSS